LILYISINFKEISRSFWGAGGKGEKYLERVRVGRRSETTNWTTTVLE
jgi:hypothetical protein